MNVAKCYPIFKKCDQMLLKRVRTIYVFVCIYIYTHTQKAIYIPEGYLE